MAGSLHREFDVRKKWSLELKLARNFQESVYRRQFLSPFLVMTLVLVAAGAAGQSEPRTLRVALSGAPEPLIIRGEDGDEPRGLIPDFWRVWATRSGHRIEWVSVDRGTSSFEVLRSGRADFLASFPITHWDSTRHSDLLITRPFARLSQAIVTPDPSLELDDLANATLRFESLGTVQQARVIAEPFGVTRYEEAPFGSLREAFEASDEPLLAPSMRWAVERLRREQLTSELRLLPLSTRPIFAAVSGERPDLIELFDRGLDAMSIRDLDGIGTALGHVGLPAFYLEPQQRLNYTKNQLEWLAKHPVIRLGVPLAPPLVTRRGGSSLSGIGIATARELFDGLGIRLLLHDEPDPRTLLRMAESRAVDGVLYARPEPDSELIETQPLLSMRAVLINRGDAEFVAGLDEMAGSKVVAPTSLSDRLDSRLSAGVERVYVASSVDAVRMLATGQADMLVDWLPQARRAIAELGETDLKVTATLEELTPPTTALVRSDWPELVELLDEAAVMRSLRDEFRLINSLAESEQAIDGRMLLLVISALVLVIALLAWNSIRRRIKTSRLLRESASMLERAQRVSKSTSWQLVPGNDAIDFSSGARQLFDTLATLPSTLDEYCDFYDAESVAELRQALAEAVDTDLSDPSPRILGSADGSRFHRVVLEHLDSGQILGTIVDVTSEETERIERLRLQENVRQTERLDALGRLAGGIAHDFNNILAASTANAELARLDLEDDHPSRESIDALIKACERGRELVQQIQIFGRPTTSHTERLEVCERIRIVVGLLSSSLPPNVSVTADLRHPIWVDASAAELDRALMNLGVNAAQAMPDGGSLHFGARVTEHMRETTTSTGVLPKGRYATIEVSDTGVGISEEDIGHVFEPYFTRRESGGGTGLGLALVHGTVKNLRGGLSVWSKERDASVPRHSRSTVFSIDLPMAFDQADDVPAGSMGPRRENSVELSYKILLVDDEPAVLDTSSRLFRRLGLDVTACSSPVEALARFRDSSDQWDGVITDLLMPEMSGAELAELIKEIEPACPVIITTGFAAEHDLRQALVDAVVMKPATGKEWRDVLEKVLSGAEADAGQTPNPTERDPVAQRASLSRVVSGS